MVAAWDTYAQQLLPLGYGHPLWGPEPCPDFGEVHLGDVGYLREGHFSFLFNAMQSADHPVHAQMGVPQGFEVFDPANPRLINRPNVITQTQLHSKSLQSISVAASASTSEAGGSALAALRYQCSEEAGALLLLKRPAHKTYMDCREHIQRYIRKHLFSWCEFANSHLGIGLEEKDIIFVSGFTKTAVWAEAAFSNDSSSGELVIAGGCFVPSASGEFRVSMQRCTDACVFSRVGPVERTSEWRDDSELLEKYDQCIFLNYYKMKTRALWWRPMILRAAAGAHVLPGHPEDGESSAMPAMCMDESNSDISDEPTYDPVDYLLDYILKHSNADVASATEEDLYALFKDQRFPDDLELALEMLSPFVQVDASGLGSIVHISGDGENPAAHYSNYDATSTMEMSAGQVLRPIKVFPHVLATRPPAISQNVGIESSVLAATNYGPTAHATTTNGSGSDEVAYLSGPHRLDSTSTEWQSDRRRSFDAILSGRKCYRPSKDKNEAVWPPCLDAALMDGLERYSPSYAESRGLKRFPNRNRYLSEYILQTTGHNRTAKQVGSRMQQLRDTSAGKAIMKTISDRHYDLMRSHQQKVRDSRGVSQAVSNKSPVHTDNVQPSTNPTNHSMSPQIDAIDVHDKLPYDPYSLETHPEHQLLAQQVRTGHDDWPWQKLRRDTPSNNRYQTKRTNRIYNRPTQDGLGLHSPQDGKEDTEGNPDEEEM